MEGIRLSAVLTGFENQFERTTKILCVKSLYSSDGLSPKFSMPMRRVQGFPVALYCPRLDQYRFQYDLRGGGRERERVVDGDDEEWEEWECGPVARH